eukprot:UN3035
MHDSVHARVGVLPGSLTCRGTCRGEALNVPTRLVGVVGRLPMTMVMRMVGALSHPGLWVHTLSWTSSHRSVGGA